MATHTHLPLYKVAYDLLGIIAGAFFIHQAAK